MRINPYLSFDGQCEAAFNLYADVLGGTIEAMITHEGTPAEEHVPADWRGKIMHARLVVGNDVLMGSDSPPQFREEPKGFHVSLNIPDAGEAERVFHALAESGTVRMPLQQTFWATRFGMLVDRFGIPWMVNCEASAES